MDRTENVKLQNTVEEIQEYSTKKIGKFITIEWNGTVFTTGTLFNVDKS
jgi:hypothetical protein